MTYKQLDHDSELRFVPNQKMITSTGTVGMVVCHASRVAKKPTKVLRQRHL